MEDLPLSKRTFLPDSTKDVYYNESPGSRILRMVQILNYLIREDKEKKMMMTKRLNYSDCDSKV